VNAPFRDLSEAGAIGGRQTNLLTLLGNPTALGRMGSGVMPFGRSEAIAL
jgi:hypothetical protein